MRTPLLVAAILAALNSAGAQHQHSDAATDSIVARAKEALGASNNPTSLRARGYNAIGFGGGIRDLSPFQGQHWISLPRFIDDRVVQLAQPQFLMFLPVADSLVSIGVAYTQRVQVDAALPTELAGVRSEWHVHMFCRQIPGEGNVLSDGVDDCRERGGIAAPNKIAMIHAWTIPNPDGPYAHDNPALPFVATGLKAPEEATRDDRAFAVALGETYGARLFVAHRIIRDARRDSTVYGAGLAKLDKLRSEMQALVPQLRDAERAGDTKKYAALRKQAVDMYGTMASEYRALSRTPEIKARFDLELERAMSKPHSHM
jgi:hypothetical protein